MYLKKKSKIQAIIKMIGFYPVHIFPLFLLSLEVDFYLMDSFRILQTYLDYIIDSFVCVNYIENFKDCYIIALTTR